MFPTGRGVYLWQRAVHKVARQKDSNGNANQAGQAAQQPVPKLASVEKGPTSQQISGAPGQPYAGYQQQNAKHDWVDYTSAVASGAQALVAVGALVAAIIAGRWATRAAEVAGENLRAFSTIEDAHLLVSFGDGLEVAGRDGFFTLRISVKNVGRSSALIRAYQVNEDYLLTDIVLEPGQSWQPPTRFQVYKIDGEGSMIKARIEYATALSERAICRAEGPILIDRAMGGIWVLVTKTSRT